MYLVGCAPSLRWDGTSHDIAFDIGGILWLWRNSLGLQPSKTKELVCEAMVDSLAVLDVLVAIESYRKL